MKIACLQIEPAGQQSLAEREAELRHRLSAVADADLVVLPELWSPGYFAFDHYREVAEKLDGPTVAMAGRLAREFDLNLHLGSLVEQGDDESLSNTTVLLDRNGELSGSYRKIHVFGYRSREQELIAPGEQLTTALVDGHRIGLATCYDLRFPELFRALVDNGAQGFVLSATWPLARMNHWATLMRARAVENLAFMVGCNAAGFNDGVELGGGSIVVGPWGDVFAEAGPEPSTLITEIDFAAVPAARAEFPVLADRRPIPEHKEVRAS